MRLGRWNRRRITVAVGGVLTGLVLCIVAAAAPAAAVSESAGEQVYAYTSTGNPDGPEVADGVARVVDVGVDSGADRSCAQVHFVKQSLRLMQP